MYNIKYKSIGIINTPYKERSGMPIQQTGAQGVKGTITIEPEYTEGLKDLDNFSHVILIYHFHLIKEYKLTLVPFMDDKPRGVFSTRAPKRPCPIGFSVVKLNKIEGDTLYIENIDVLNETPLLDIKPYIPNVDCVKADKLGWLEGKSEKMGDAKSDNRFK